MDYHIISHYLPFIVFFPGLILQTNEQGYILMSKQAQKYNQLLIYQASQMAFVFGKTQKRSVFESKIEVPGPGQYNQPSSFPNQHSAPFNSSTFKQSEFDVNPTTAGPGSYNPNYQKSLNTDKRARMTSSFNSKVQRFKSPQHPNSDDHPSIKMKVSFNEPKQYDNQSLKEVIKRSKQKMNALQDANNQRKTNSITVNKQFVRIILSNPHNTEMNHSIMIESSIVKKQNGPGSYNIEPAKELLNKSMHVVDWSKGVMRRFKTQKNKNPGPGEYEVQPQLRRSISSTSAVFAYQGLRSHMDEVIYKTKMPFKVKVIESKHLKDRYPGPGQYEPKITTSKSFHYGQEAFGSFVTQQSSKQNQPVPGPGYYYQLNSNNANSLKDEIRKTREKIFGKTKQKLQKVSTLENNHKQQIRKQCIRDIENENNKYYSLQERCTSKIGNFAQSERFKNNTKIQKVACPGPGQYKINNRSEEQFQKGIQHGFNSTSDRLTDEIYKPHKKIPYYEVDRNDMGKRALRIKKNIQNLKQIDIEKAPFNCKKQRFSPQEKIQKNMEEMNSNWNPLKTQVKQERPYRGIKDHEANGKRGGVNRTEQSVFKSRSKRSWMVQSSEVGPGNYNYTTTLEKKSFNQQYHYKPPIKIRSTYKTRSSLA